MEIDNLCQQDATVSLCSQTVPRYIYRINRYLSPTEVQQYIFVGEHLADQEIAKILRKIESVESLTESDGALLQQKLGANYKDILGLDNSYPKQYIGDYIEIDDTIDKIKLKIQNALTPGKYHSGMTRQIPHPVSFQYLWTPLCYRYKSGTKSRPTPLGGFYFYNSDVETTHQIIRNYENIIKELNNPAPIQEIQQELDNMNVTVQQLTDEIAKLQLYIADYSNRPKRRRRFVEAVQVEDGMQIGLLDANPFAGLPKHVVKFTHVDQLFVDQDGQPSNNAVYESQNDKVLQDYLLMNHREINLVSLIDFLDYLRGENYIFTSGAQAENTVLDIYYNTPEVPLRFINGFLTRYWTKYEYAHHATIKALKSEDVLPTFNVGEFVPNIWLNTGRQGVITAINGEASKFAPSLAKLENDRKKIAIITDPLLCSATIQPDCKILETVFHINFNAKNEDFVNLLVIFDAFPLSEKVPHVKYRGDNDESLHKVFKGLSNILPKEEIVRWVSDKPQKSKTDDDTVKYVVSGRGLTYKVKVYDPPSPATKDAPAKMPKYGTLIILKDGKIELKISWEEDNGASLQDIQNSLKIFREVIEQINKIQYHLKGADRKLKLGLPDPEFNSNPHSNTQLSLINAVSLIEFERDIDFTELNKLAQCFHETYSAVIRTDLSVVGDKIQSIPSNSLKLRYKRISFYKEMSDYEKLVYELRQQSRKPNVDTVAGVLAEQFRKDGITLEIAKKIAEYNLAKKVKHPGIDVRVRENADGIIKTTILGSKNLLQLAQVNFYVRQLLCLYHYGSDKYKIDNMIKNECRVDIETLRRANPQLQQMAEIEEAEEFKVYTAEELLAMGDEEDEGEAGALAGLEDDLDESDLPDETDLDITKPTETVKVAPKKKRILAEKSAITRLEDADPELFKGHTYSKGCQRSDFRQPMVISGERYREQLKNANDDLAKAKKLPDSNPERNKLIKQAEAKLKVLDNKASGVILRENYYYFCATAFCYDCETVLTPDEIESHTKQFGHTNIYSVAGDNLKLPTFIGFLDPTKHAGACLPCCFKNTKIDQPAFKSCKTQLTTGQAGTATGDEGVSSNPLYVFNSEKRFIAKDRFAFLPKEIDVLISSNTSGINCTTVNGNIKAGTNFNCYLRKGMQSLNVDVKNSFIIAMADLVEKPRMNAEQFRKFLAEKVSRDLFNILLNGNLKIIFTADDEHTDKSEIDPYQNFLNYLKSDFVNEDFLWDLVSHPQVIDSRGLNLLIFEATFNPNKTIQHIMLKCPIGFDLETLFKYDRPSVILFKYSDNYEPIYRVFDQNSNLMQEKFFSSDNIFIKSVLDLYLGQDSPCRVEDDVALLKELKNFYQKYNIPDLQLDTPLSASQTYQILEELSGSVTDLNDIVPVEQIVDNMNKVTHLVLSGGLKFPVKPSIILDTGDLPVREYYTTAELDEISKAVATGKAPKLTLPTYQTVFKLLYQLNDLSIQLNQEDSLNCIPRMNVIDNESGLVVGILMRNGLTVEVFPIQFDQLAEISVTTPTGVIRATGIDADIAKYRDSLADQAVVNRELVDLSLKTGKPLIADAPNLRQLEVSKNQFEEESYQRARFEISRFLQLDANSDIKQALYDLINNDGEATTLTLKQRRQEVYDIVLELLSILSTSTPTNDNYLANYQKPNIRTACFESDGKCNDSHCAQVNGVCKLFIPKNNLVKGKVNLNYYAHLIADELVRNKLKALELLEDQIDIYIKRGTRKVSSTEVIFGEGERDKEHTVRQTKVNKMYQKGVDYLERWRTNPEIYRGHYDEDAQKFVSKKPAQLSAYWIEKVGRDTGLRRIPNSGNEYIYEMLANSLTQRDIILGKPTVHSTASIKARVWQFISNELEPEIVDNVKVRDGWKLFAHKLSFRLHDKPEYKNLHNINVKETFESQLYNTVSHILTEYELAMISRLYGIKFIILRGHRFPHEDPVSPMFMCLHTTQTTEDWYVLLYASGVEKYEMVIDTSISRIKGCPFPYRYVFDGRVGANQIPATIYAEWKSSCSADNKDFIDPNNYMLIREITPEPMPMNVAKKYFLKMRNPQTGELVEAPKHPSDVIISPPTSPRSSSPHKIKSPRATSPIPSRPSSPKMPKKIFKILPKLPKQIVPPIPDSEPVNQLLPIVAPVKDTFLKNMPALAVKRVLGTPAEVFKPSDLLSAETDSTQQQLQPIIPMDMPDKPVITKPKLNFKLKKTSAEPLPPTAVEPIQPELAPPSIPKLPKVLKLIPRKPQTLEQIPEPMPIAEQITTAPHPTSQPSDLIKPPKKITLTPKIKAELIKDLVIPEPPVQPMRPAEKKKLNIITRLK